MVLSLYGLIEAGILCVNALAILNLQRILSTKSGNENPHGYAGDSHNPDGVKQKIFFLIRSVRTVMRIPLIAFNIVTILFLILLG